jgi:hypothetical protein
LRIYTIGQMPAKLYRIKLSGDERLQLEAIRDNKNPRKAKDATPKKAITKRAMAALSLLLSDEGPLGPSMKDADIMGITGLSSCTLERLRKRCCEVGPLAALGSTRCFHGS